MTRAEIAAFFPASSVNFGALDYEVPTLAWLRGPFYDAFRQRLWSENDDKWKKRFECRDFAALYRAMALECWGTSDGVVSDSDGLAIGEVWFVPDAAKPSEGHAINAIFTENGLQFIDPQNNTLWPMSPAQFASLYFVRF